MAFRVFTLEYPGISLDSLGHARVDTRIHLEHFALHPCLIERFVSVLDTARSYSRLKMLLLLGLFPSKLVYAPHSPD